MDTETQVGAPVLPRWKCHKVVAASRITDIRAWRDGDVDPTTTLTLEHGTKDVTVAWVRKTGAERGGYFVQYEDGYESYSPAAAFEAGYTLIPVETAPETKDETPETPADAPKDEAPKTEEASTDAPSADAAPEVPAT